MAFQSDSRHDEDVTTTCEARVSQPEADLALIELTGDVDAGAAEVLGDAYTAAAGQGAPRVMIDFARVGYINRTGIALIVGILARARRDQRQLIARGLSERYRQLFEITRLADFIQVLEPSF
jgi:anti-sigma B factor antagonist